MIENGVGAERGAEERALETIEIQDQQSLKVPQRF